MFIRERDRFFGRVFYLDDKYYNIVVLTDKVRRNLVDDKMYVMGFKLSEWEEDLTMDDFIVKLHDEDMVVITKEIYIPMDFIKKENYIGMLDDDDIKKLEFYLHKGFLPEQAEYKEHSNTRLWIMKEVIKYIPEEKIGRYIQL